MVDNKVKKTRYAFALILTLFIFSFGLLLGLLLSGERTKYVEDEIKLQKLDFDSLQIQYLYIDSLLGNKDCDGVSKTLKENINHLENTRVKLEGYISSSLGKNDEFKVIKREYMLAELRYWLMARKAIDICEEDTVTVLYFYSGDEDVCPDCHKQGTILSFLKETFGGKLLVFSLDADFEQEPLLRILKQTYDVNLLPSIIVKDRKLDGLVKKDRLIDEVCSNYLSKPKACMQDAM